MRRFTNSERVMDDTGMTLVELIVASTLLVILTTVVAVTMGVFNQVSINVSASYQEYNQILPALQPLASLLRAEVEPAPSTTYGVSPTSAPSPGFVSVGNFSLTFYANVGTAYGNVVAACVRTSTTCPATSAGPAKIVAQEIDHTGSAVTSTSKCTTKTGETCSFVVRRYLPSTVDGVSTCPGVGSGPQCTYPATYTEIVNVSGVVNNPIPPLSVSDTPLSPIFTYNTCDPVTYAVTSLTVASGQLTPTSAASAIQLDSILSVDVNLRVALKSSSSQNVAENHLLAYRYPAPVVGAPYPFQYTTSVG
jgi:hypothetical protein